MFKITEKQQNKLNAYNHQIAQINHSKKLYLAKIYQQRKHYLNFELAIHQILNKTKTDYNFHEKINAHNFRSLTKHIQQNMHISDEFYDKVIGKSLKTFMKNKDMYVPNQNFALNSEQAKTNFNNFYHYETKILPKEIQIVKDQIGYDNLHFGLFKVNSKYQDLRFPTDYQSQTRILTNLKKHLQNDPTSDDVNAIISYLIHVPKYYKKNNKVYASGKKLVQDFNLCSRTYILPKLLHNYINLALSLKAFKSSGHHDSISMDCLKDDMKVIKKVNQSKLNVNESFLLNRHMTKEDMIIAPFIDMYGHDDFDVTLVNAKELTNIISCILNDSQPLKHKPLDWDWGLADFDIMMPPITPWTYRPISEAELTSMFGKY